MRRDEQLDDMIRDNRELSIKLSKAQEERDALAARLHQCKSAVCRECSGSGEIGLADGEVPCPACGGSGDPTKTGPFPTVNVRPTESKKSD